MIVLLIYDVFTIQIATERQSCAIGSSYCMIFCLLIYLYSVVD